MRSLTLWLCVLGSLLVATQAFQLPNIEEPEEDVLDELDEDEDVDIGRILGELFEDEEIDEDDDDDEEVTGRQLATVTGSEQERYNTFMDTLLAQLNRQVKRDMEPLKITLTSAKKNRKNGKKNVRKNSKKDRKNAKKDEKDKKGKRNPKEVDLTENTDIAEEVHQIKRREAEAEEEVTGRKANNENKKDNNENKKDKKNKDDENTDEKRGKNRKNKNRNNGSKKNSKKNRRQGRSNNKVVLHGLSHITREGDVQLYNMKKGRVLRTEFNIGPVELDIIRKFGSGKDADERKAAASADQLKGKMLLKVNKQGKPKIKKLSIKRPNNIKMSGSVAHNQGPKKGFFKKSVKQVSPTAAKKLMKAAKAIIQSV